MRSSSTPSSSTLTSPYRHAFPYSMVNAEAPAGKVMLAPYEQDPPQNKEKPPPLQPKLSDELSKLHPSDVNASLGLGREHDSEASNHADGSGGERGGGGGVGGGGGRCG